MVAIFLGPHILREHFSLTGEASSSFFFFFFFSWLSVPSSAVLPFDWYFKLCVHGNH